MVCKVKIKDPILYLYDNYSDTKYTSRIKANEYDSLELTTKCTNNKRTMYFSPTVLSWVNSKQLEPFDDSNLKELNVNLINTTITTVENISKSADNYINLYDTDTSSNQDDEDALTDDELRNILESEGYLADIIHFSAYESVVGAITNAVKGTNIYRYIDSVTGAIEEYRTGTQSGDARNSLSINRYGYVHGLPFQFTPLTDRRYYNNYTESEVGSDLYGRSFAQTIIMDTPVVVFSPGLPKYMTSELTGFTASSQDKSAMAKYLMGLSNGIEDLLNPNKSYEYYTIAVSSTEYFKYVNTLTRNSSILMDINNMEYTNGVKLENLDWGKFNKDVDNASVLADVLGIDGGVAFAFDPQSGISDTITNQITDSSIVSQLSQYSAQIRELEFLAGSTGVGKVINDVQAAIDGLFSNGSDSTFARIMSGINNTVQGLNIKFPEIWADSLQQKSYSCEMKFVSPYASAFCCWRYVLVPFFHLLCLATPRSIKSLNTYSSPFLIRAFSKGYFNVEMGIIDSLTYRRFGDGTMLSADGVPMQMDCDVAFHDMYKQLTLATAGGTNAFLFYSNTGLIDLLGTLSGVNMCRLSLADRMSLFVVDQYNAVADLRTNFRRRIADTTATIFTRIMPTV